MNETVGRVGISGRFGKTWKSDRGIISLINIDQVDVRAHPLTLVQLFASQ